MTLRSLGLASFALAIACAPRPRPVDPGPPSGGLAPETRRADRAREVPPASTPAPASAGTSSAPVEAAGPPRADAVPARGVEPLSTAERDEMLRDCKRLQDRVGHQASADRRDKRWSAYVEEVLSKAPRKLEGVPDVARCKDLLRRDARAQEASVMEAEAIDALKRIAASLSLALEKTGAFCPGAGPVPPSIEAVREGYYVPKPADFTAPGWKCVSFASTAPTRWQLELRVDAAAGTFEAVARGYPVLAEGPEELYVRGEAKEGKLPLTLDVLRRR